MFQMVDHSNDCCNGNKMDRDMFWRNHRLHTTSIIIHKLTRGESLIISNMYFYIMAATEYSCVYGLLKR